MPFFEPYPNFNPNRNKNYRKLNNYTSNNFEKNTFNSKNVEKNKKKSEKLDNNNFSDNFDNYRFFLNLFGINLYFDDILIICLLFFLYNEHVHDEELFLCLILLLFS